MSDDLPWLLLVPQLPAKPAYLRVKIWRRLQALGAATLKNAVHALPLRRDTSAALEALRREIIAGGGDALILEARLAGGIDDGEVRALFDAARDADYEEIAADARDLLARGEIAVGDVARLAARRAEVGAIDFFAAHGGQMVDDLIAQLDERARQHPDVSRRAPPPPIAIADLQARTWVTRRGVHVDRIASAWLIGRFIDPEARFKFVDGHGYAPEPHELRFDMADAEFTHEGDRCTFETLVLRAGLSGDAALVVLSEIIHDLDTATPAFGRPEAAGVGALIAGVCAATPEDAERIARAGAALDGLYAHFSRSPGGPK
jgi:hypothetical protein